MIYKNTEIHNAAHIYDGTEGIRMLRAPKNVYDKLERGQNADEDCTGVELRFVMKSDKVTLKMRSYKEGITSTFHVFYGGIQGGWSDHEVNRVLGTEMREFIIEKNSEQKLLEDMTKEGNFPFSPSVVRIVFDRGYIELGDIIGDVEPPTVEMLPKKTLLCYGSSITHGSNAICYSNSWVSYLAKKLGVDCRNLGHSGSCLMEKEMVNYIANEKWDIAVLELGINALDWDDNEKIRSRVDYTVSAVAEKNPDKPIFVISPFYTREDFEGKTTAQNWRDIISDVVKKRNYKNVKYISGAELIDNISLISADFVHPSIYGVEKICNRLYEHMKKCL